MNTTGTIGGTVGGTTSVDDDGDEIIIDNDRNERFLSKLCRQNELRRQRLRELHSEYDQELKVWKEENKNDSPKFNLARPPLEEHYHALEVEWELLQETKEQTFEKSLVNIASIFPDFNQQQQQQQQQQQGNIDRPSDAVVRHCLLQEFSEEVIESYHDLATTHSTISQVLERETAKLELKRSFLLQQQKLLAELQEQLQHYKEKEETTSSDNSNNNMAQEDQDQVSRLKQQYQWIRQELHYVTQKLLAATLENHETDNQSRPLSKPKTRKRTKGISGKKSAVDPSNTEPSKNAMEEIIYQLIQRLLEDPSNPYMLVGEDPNTNNGRERDQRRKDIINILIECGVALPHDDNHEGWRIRLTDYQA